MDALRSTLGIARQDLAVLFDLTGRPEKGHHVALLALAETRRRGLLIHLVSVGPAARLPLFDAARALGIEHAFHDVGPKEDVDLRLAMADLCIVPSMFEPLGLVAVEALASGTPLVASATGRLLEIVEDGSTGGLAVPGSSLSLRTAYKSRSRTRTEGGR